MLIVGRDFIFFLKIVGVVLFGAIAEGSEKGALLKKSSESLPDKLQSSLDLGDFKDWNYLDSYSFSNGLTMVLRTPPWFKGDFVSEGLEITTMPLMNASVDHFFETEKNFIENQANRKINFHILKKSPTEVVYYYVRPFFKKSIHINGVVRTFVTEQGYYSIHYKLGLPDEMPLEMVLKWKEQLERVKVTSFLQEAPN